MIAECRGEKVANQKHGELHLRLGCAEGVSGFLATPDDIIVLLKTSHIPLFAAAVSREKRMKEYMFIEARIRVFLSLKRCSLTSSITVAKR
jgi:hypothetical protein